MVVSFHFLIIGLDRDSCDQNGDGLVNHHFLVMVDSFNESSDEVADGVDELCPLVRIEAIVAYYNHEFYLF